jgi:hypothetical protein
MAAIKRVGNASPLGLVDRVQVRGDERAAHREQEAEA